jgi:hypothetical protein
MWTKGQIDMLRNTCVYFVHIVKITDSSNKKFLPQLAYAVYEKDHRFYTVNHTRQTNKFSGQNSQSLNVTAGGACNYHRILNS